MALKLEATLTDIYSNPLGGKTIIFYYSLDGTNYTEIERKTTDPNGKATTTYQNTYYGTIWFKAVFPGDPEYEGSEAVVKYEFGYLQIVTNIIASLLNYLWALMPFFIIVMIMVAMASALRVKEVSK